MKFALKISILFNLGLLGAVILLLLNGCQRVAEPPPRAVVETRPPADTVAAAQPPALVSAKPAPFRWNQLAAGDYRVYVKNLRAIGCPELTLRAIVSADVDAAFRVRYNELEKGLSDLAGSSWTNQLANVSNGAALKAELQKLPDEEAAEINDLLGVQQVATTGPASSQQDLASNVVPIVPPLAFQPVDLAAMDLDDRQIQAIKDLRQTFLDKIGGINQDPNDPAYVARWQQAQPEVDDLMQGMLGDADFQNYQLQARALAQANPTANP